MVARTPGLAVVINLDYLNISSEICQLLWNEVERAMIQAGFALDGRVFVARDQMAAETARLVMKSLEPVFDAYGVSQFDAVREFYSYDLSTRVDLNMAGAAEQLEVEITEYSH
ncbi:hypothetical protein [Chitinimonas sp.]|uniref:hypothetical protein n=1 Tax=Chitinimonas sp. TaxID=1934313 RepID=UPI0035B3DD21